MKRALVIIGPNISVAERHENAALLSTLLLLQAEALELAGRPADARTVSSGQSWLGTLRVRRGLGRKR